MTAMKKFYGRNKELTFLDSMERQSATASTFTVVMGRRRVGKTELLKEYAKGKRSCYLFVSRTTETLLCREWQNQLQQSLGLAIHGRIERVDELFAEIFDYARNEHFLLVVDEFQDLERINPAIFSDLQNLWDIHAEESHLNLVVCGSAYSLMTRIFEDAKEPLFGRATARLELKPLPPSITKEILRDYNPSCTPEDLLCLYMLTGGIPRYLSLLMDFGAYTKGKMIETVTDRYSAFLSDGKDILISEIGKEYTVYFSILRLISEGYTTQSEIDSVIKKNTGAYLEKLESSLRVIQRKKPLLSKEESRKAHWEIKDPYLRFYFRFFYANQSLIELEQTNKLQELILRDYETFTGKTLESWFYAKMLETESFSAIGGWWDKRGENEIDLILLDSLEKTCRIYEIKRKKEKLDMAKLSSKVETFKIQIPGYRITMDGLSMEDM